VSISTLKEIQKHLQEDLSNSVFSNNYCGYSLLLIGYYFIFLLLSLIFYYYEPLDLNAACNLSINYRVYPTIYRRKGAIRTSELRNTRSGSSSLRREHYLQPLGYRKKKKSHPTYGESRSYHTIHKGARVEMTRQFYVQGQLVKP
jgi:hypothetical protein